MTTIEQQARGKSGRDLDWRAFPWWLTFIIGFLILMGYLLITGEEYNRAFEFIKGGLGGFEMLRQGDLVKFIGSGISVTIYTTLTAFLVAMVLGLLAGLGRISQNTLVRNLAITYVEFVRGVPTLVLIFTLAFVIVPEGADLLGWKGARSPPIRGRLRRWRLFMARFWRRCSGRGLSRWRMGKWRRRARWG